MSRETELLWLFCFFSSLKVDCCICSPYIVEIFSVGSPALNLSSSMAGFFSWQRFKQKCCDLLLLYILCSLVTCYCKGGWKGSCNFLCHCLQSVFRTLLNQHFLVPLSKILTWCVHLNSKHFEEASCSIAPAASVEVHILWILYQKLWIILTEFLKAIQVQILLNLSCRIIIN